MPARNGKANKPAKRRRGAPRTVMTQPVIDGILRAVAEGMHPEAAARIQGIDAAALRMHKSRNPDFVTALEKAEAQAESGWLSRIIAHADKQWTAAAWLLERRYRERWRKDEGPTTAIQVNTNVGPPVPEGAELRDWLERFQRIVAEDNGLDD